MDRQIKSSPELPPARSAKNDQSESVWSLAAFWLVAFTGSALFAAVLIAPRWEERQKLRDRVQRQSRQCQYLADINDHFTRVLEAFKHDPEFNTEVARFALGYTIANEQSLPAPVRNWAIPKPPRAEPPSPDAWSPFVRLFAHDLVVRRTALISAAVFIVVSLAFFNTSCPSEQE
jgi:hypothetical protein